MIMLLMSSLVKSHNWSFLPRIGVRDKLQQESRKTKEKTGFPLKNCGNDIFLSFPDLIGESGNISNVLLLMVSLVILIFFVLINGCATTGTTSKAPEEIASPVSDEVPKVVKIKEFILGPGDKVDIVVYRYDDLKRTVQIDTSGKITYPLIGDIQAGGLSIFQLRDRIRDGLSRYIKNPQVSVGIASVQSQKVIVLGEVNNPGLFTLDNPLTALEAISRAGGFTMEAKQKRVLLIRGGLEKPDIMTIDFDRVLSGYDIAQNVSLQNGDIIYVPATFIANVSRFFDHLSRIISPIVSMESGYYIGQQIESREATPAISPK